METGATYSPCRKYRYELWRTWDASSPAVMFIGLNPSTANETHDDPTIRRCIGFAQRFEYGGLIVCNLFAYCATDTKDMLAAEDPVGRDNDDYLIANAKEAGIVIAAWGNNGRYLNRSESVVALIPNLYCLKLNASGEPAHPLYLPKDAQLSMFCGTAR
jgi:hypothetical protein